MNILAIDTATECCSVALRRDIQSDEPLVDQLKEITPNGHSKLVLGMVNKLLHKNTLQLKDIDLIAVDIGPGSFTGLRIGIGVAQGLAYTTNIPTLGIQSLHALAAVTSSEQADLVIPAIDARMKQIYWAIFEPKNNEQISIYKVSNPSNLTTDSIPLDESKTIRTIGSGWDTYQEELNDAINETTNTVHIAGQFPEAKYIAKIASQSSKDCYTPAKHLCAAYIRNDIVR